MSEEPEILHGAFTEEEVTALKTFALEYSRCNWAWRKVKIFTIRTGVALAAVITALAAWPAAWKTLRGWVS